MKGNPENFDFACN